MILPLVSFFFSSGGPIKRWQSIRIHQISELEQLKLLHYYVIKRTNSWEFFIYFRNRTLVARHVTEKIQFKRVVYSRIVLHWLCCKYFCMSVVQEVHLYANRKTTYWKEIEDTKTAFSFNCNVFVVITRVHAAPTVSSFSHAISLLTPFNPGMLYHFLLPHFHNSV